MARGTPRWWVFLLSAAFLGYFALLVYCDVRRPENYGFEADFTTGRMLLSRVASESPASPAARAGLASGDVIVEVDGKPILGLADWTVVEGTVEFGRPIHLRVLRGGDLQVPAQQNSTQFETAFCIGIEAKKGTTTGISAADRARTIQVAINSRTKAVDLARPGHVFPLRARDGGVLVRAGQTEAAVDLARIAGLYPAGVICEIASRDGSMARVPELAKFAKRHKLLMITVADLIRYRMQTEGLVSKAAEADLPTEHGPFRIHGYESVIDGQTHVALVCGELGDGENVLVRVHSKCLTGDVFHSARCDCGPQLDAAMQRIAAEGRGVLLYLNQEGRGIGLANKLRAYALQDQGLDTVEANERLGFKADQRDYGIGAQILRDLGVRTMRLLTNNPRKFVGLQGYGLSVAATVPLEIPASDSTRRYLKVKKDKLGHRLKSV